MDSGSEHWHLLGLWWKRNSKSDWTGWWPWVQLTINKPKQGKYSREAETEGALAARYEHSRAIFVPISLHIAQDPPKYPLQKM